MDLFREYLLPVCAPPILPGGSSPVFFLAPLCRPDRVAREKVLMSLRQEEVKLSGRNANGPPNTNENNNN